MDIVDPGGPLSDAEFRDLVRLLARYAERELDQGNFWKINTSYGPVYVQLHRGLPSGWPEEDDRLFSTVWPLPAHLQEDRQGSGNPQQ
jgi:hypothetical protein